VVVVLVVVLVVVAVTGRGGVNDPQLACLLLRSLSAQQ
jgi:hypothetical protein